MRQPVLLWLNDNRPEPQAVRTGQVLQERQQPPSVYASLRNSASRSHLRRC